MPPPNQRSGQFGIDSNIIGATPNTSKSCPPPLKVDVGSSYPLPLAWWLEKLSFPMYQALTYFTPEQLQYIRFKHPHNINIKGYFKVKRQKLKVLFVFTWQIIMACRNHNLKQDYGAQPCRVTLWELPLLLANIICCIWCQKTSFSCFTWIKFFVSVLRTVLRLLGYSPLRKR